MPQFQIHCFLIFCSILLIFLSPTCALKIRKTTECRQSFDADRPVLISSNNGSESRHCSYVINEPPNTLPDHVFQVSLLSFNLGHPSNDGSTCEEGWARLGGSLYCGGPASDKTFLFYPTSKYRTYLDLEISPSTVHDFQARVELLPRLTLQERHPEMILATPGEPIRYTDCDRVYKCLESPGYCQITSPNYPGSYPRPLNCTYKLKSLEPGIIIGGRHELFEVGNYNKLSQNCDSEDYLAIYDGGELISKFCGKTKKFPRIVSKTSEIIIQFVSKNAGLPSKGFVLSIERSPPHITEHANCLENIQAGTTVQQVKSPHHWIAPKSHCSYTLSVKPGKQIWLLITNLKTRNNCSELDEHVLIYDGNELLAKYCKQDDEITPIVSKNHHLKLVYHSPNGTLDATSKLHYIAKFAAVNSIETGLHIPNTWCDTVFSTTKSGPFSLLNPKDIILHNVKGNSNETLICKYHFKAPDTYTVRLQLDYTSFEPLYRCNSVINICNSENYDKVLITEKLKTQILGCECGARKHPQIFHSKGSEMIITLSLNLNYDLVNSSLKYSPELYQFKGRYQFIPPDNEALHCGNYKLTNYSLQFPTKSNLYISSPILCHWYIKNISLSALKLINFNISNDCKQNFIIISYNKNNEIKLCNGNNYISDLNEFKNVNIYLIANKGQPQFTFNWYNSEQLPINNEDEYEEERSFYECYGALTLGLFMAAAAIVTMTVVLAIALIIWRYRESVWFTWRSRGRQRYSSVTRNITGAFW